MAASHATAAASAAAKAAVAAGLSAGVSGGVSSSRSQMPPALSSTQFHSLPPTLAEGGGGLGADGSNSSREGSSRAQRPGRTGPGERPRAILPPIEKFRWHELHNGPELIVFGHDAKQGLFRKTTLSGRPVCVGIDTGCTYGRALTGYFPEFDDAIQVPARRTYFDIVKNVIMVRSASPRVAV